MAIVVLVFSFVIFFYVRDLFREERKIKDEGGLGFLCKELITKLVNGNEMESYKSRNNSISFSFFEKGHLHIYYITQRNSKIHISWSCKMNSGLKLGSHSYSWPSDWDQNFMAQAVRKSAKSNVELNEK